MSIYVGTCGYSHKEWKGNFYPADVRQKYMLEYYSQRFPAVEINNTFRQLPTADAIKGWLEQSPESFRFTLKARQAITHFKRLVGAERETDDFLNVAARLGPRLGPILFQLPAILKCDVSRLDQFLAYIAGRAQAAFDFQHESWHTADVYDCLKSHRATVVASDGDGPTAGLIPTADWSYVRLCGEKYTDEQLRKWLEETKAADFADSYVIFTHTDMGISPQLAARFMELAET